MSDSVIRFLSDNNLLIQIDWNDIVNLPAYIDNLSGCLACDDIAALSAVSQLLTESMSSANIDIADLQGQILDILNQLNTKVSVSVFNKHHHDCRYYTKNQLKYPSTGGEVNWFNITSLTPAMSAIYNSSVTKDHLLAITTPVNSLSDLASSGNPFVTFGDLMSAISGSASQLITIPVFDTTTINIDRGASRQSDNIYDIYYNTQGLDLTKDWSPLKYHLEYMVHRRNPLYTIPAMGDPTEVEWIDEDIDGNKVWIGERQIFTGGKDGVSFQSGSFSTGRATTPSSSVVGLPNVDDLYNNVTSGQRESEFANRQIIVYGGIEVGRNFNMLAPISGSQVLSASGASAYFNNMTIYGDINVEGSIINTSGTFKVDSLSGSISGSGNLQIADHASLRNYLQIFNANGTSSIFKVDANDIVGTQSNININNFSLNNGNLSINGSFNALGVGNIHGNGYLDIDGYADIGGNLTAVGAGNFGGKLTVGGASQVSTFESGIRSNGDGFFFGGITNPNLYDYTGFFGGNVLISGGLTIQDYFETAKDLIIHQDLTVYNDSNLLNNVTACTKMDSKFVIGQTNGSLIAGDTYILNWSNEPTTNVPRVSKFKIFTRELDTSANLLTLRASEENVLGSGVNIGPSVTQNKSTNSYINAYSTWDGVDIRRSARPSDVYRSDGTWSGIEVKTYLKQLDEKYSDSQYLLWTSNPFAFSNTTPSTYGSSNPQTRTPFPGIGGYQSTENFPNNSEAFGWIMTDWFRTATEESKNITFPLHLIASKNYVDYRMEHLGIAGGVFQVAPENIGHGIAGVPQNNDVISWDGTKFTPRQMPPPVWGVSYIPVFGDVTITMPTENTVFILTYENLSGPFKIFLPQQQVNDVKKEIIIKFLDIPAEYFPVTVNAYTAETIDDITGEYLVTVPKSAIKLLIPQHHSWIIV